MSIKDYTYDELKETSFTFASSRENKWFKDDEDKNRSFREYLLKRYSNYASTLEDAPPEK